MNARDDGGQAFPSEFFETEHGDRVQTFAGSPGMTLRDYFAAQALPAILMGVAEGRIRHNSGRGLQLSDYAAAAYQHADAMLAERSK